MAGCGDTTEDESFLIENSDEGRREQGSTCVSTSIEGRWVLESWEENGGSIDVEVGVNAVSEPWIEFTQTFEGVRASFVSADGTGSAVSGEPSVDEIQVGAVVVDGDAPDGATEPGGDH